MTNKNNSCTVIMYHYVRDLAHSRYPRIKGLDLSFFVEQIEYLEKHYHFVTIETIIDSMAQQVPLPPKSVLLTFDDGYIDHFNHVFPILNKKKIQGCFYIPVKTTCENIVLDVNKIHHIIANTKDISLLTNDLLAKLDENRTTYNLDSNAHYLQKRSKPGRLDPAEVMFIKKMLQVELPEQLRNEITDFLFTKYVSSDEKSFSRDLYMNEEQIECMQRNGMHIGGHGDKHYWLGSLNKEAQRYEIQQSKSFIQRIGGSLDYWTFCYPYGDFNQDTLDILGEEDCKLALTVQAELLNTQLHTPLQIPRLDTNYIPKNKDAVPNEWFHKAMA